MDSLGFLAPARQEQASATMVAMPVPGQPPKPIVPLTVDGIEASGLVKDPDGDGYLVISDDTPDNRPFLFLMNTTGQVTREIPILGLDAMADMEGIAAGAKGALYLISSLSETKGGKRHPSRHLLIRARKKGEHYYLEHAVDMVDLLTTAARKTASVQRSGLITVADIRLLVTDLSGPANTSSNQTPLLADRQMRVRLAEAEYNLEVAKNRDFISFFDVRYDMDEREETDKAVSLEVALRLPFIHPDRDAILNRRVKWMEAKNELAEVEKKWSQKRESKHRRLLRYLDQHDVLNARKKTGEAATSYSLYRQMDGVNPLDLLKIRESILKNDMRIQKAWFAALRCFVDLIDLDRKLSARPLVNYLTAAKERIL